MTDIGQPRREIAGDQPRAITGAFWMVIVGTALALFSNVLELQKAFAAGQGGIGTASDLALTIAFIAMYGFFAEMMRKGRQWGRVMMTIFAALGLVFNTLGLLHLGGRPITGALQSTVAALGGLASIIGLVCMFVPSANAFYREVRDQARNVSPGLRKVMLTAHVGISVGWLGLIVGMLAMATTAALSNDAKVQYSVYTMMYLLDAIFLGMTSLFAMLTGVIGAAGSPWHLMRRRWVSVKFVVTIVVMMFGFGVIHPLITRANGLVTAGAAPAEVRQVGIPLAVCAGIAVSTLIFMTILSTYKPWGFTRYGRRKLAAVRTRPPVRASRTPVSASRR